MSGGHFNYIQFRLWDVVDQIQELIDNFNGNARVSYKVKGYWSADTITVYVRKDFIGTTRGNGIVVNVSHSSGGRDTDEVKQDFEAVQYFAEALNDASKVAEFLFNESEIGRAHV